MKNRSIILSSLACLLFSTVVTYQKPAHAQIHIPAPVVERTQKLALMAGLYGLAYCSKGWVKTLSEDTVAYWSGVQKLDEYNELRALAKMEDRGFWAIVSFAVHDTLIMIGFPVPAAFAATVAFNAGLTGPLMFGDVPARLNVWHDTFNPSADINAGIVQKRSREIPHSTALYCGPLNAACVYEQPKNSTAETVVAREVVVSSGQQVVMNLLSLARDVGIMCVGYYTGLSAYKLGKAVSTTAVKVFVPHYSEDNIYQAHEYMKIAYVMQKMMGKLLESYTPSAAHDQVIKPLVLAHPDYAKEHNDASFYAGLFGEIFMYVPMEDHKKLWHEVWG